MIEKICIIGVGLIGGSFAKGLKNAKKVKTICGFGRSKAHLSQAKKLGVIDEYSTDIATAVKDVDLVLISTPVDSFGQILQSIKPHIKDTTIISDVGSTKGSVIQIAQSVFGKMPPKFVPAHPIAGREKSGVESIDDGLFVNKRVILTPEKQTDAQAIELVSELWHCVGASVEIMSHKDHDDLLAMTSHLPHMLAFGLMDYLIKNNPNACDYAAGGFKDFSRIASSDAIMWRDICLNNSDDIIKHINGYKETLDRLSKLIKNHDAQALQKLFEESKQARDNWLDD